MEAFWGLIIIGIAISLFRWYSSQDQGSGQGGFSGFGGFPTQVYGHTLTTVHLFEHRPNGASVR